jgi:glycosyltransferase involved in cell wall biosynthesis
MGRQTDILFLGLHRPGRSPSQRYRIEQFLPAIEEMGLRYDYRFLLDEQMDKVFYSPGAYFGKALIVLKSLFSLVKWTFIDAKKYRYIFVQREAWMLGTAFFEKQMAKRAKLIFDFDDSIWLPNVSAANQKLAFLKNPSKTSDIIQVANRTVVGNPYLADYAGQFTKNIVLIPTAVDTDEYHRRRPLAVKKDGRVCIGWSGSQTTIEHFKLLEPVLREIKAKYGTKVYFKVIGDGSYANRELGIQGIQWTRETELAALEEIDIGIMPLPDDEWSKGKCGLKALVYMAMEIPAVLADVGVNSEIVTDGVTGLLSASHEDWIEKLSLLIENAELRCKLGKAGRERVEASYSVKANQDKFIALFNE